MIREAVGAIIHQGDAYIVVCKSWQHTLNGEMKINDEWDIVKGGVEKKAIHRWKRLFCESFMKRQGQLLLRSVTSLMPSYTFHSLLICKKRLATARKKQQFF